MRVSYDEGVASHIGSESCGGIREDTVEALTAGGEPVESGYVRAGYRASKILSGVPTACVLRKATPGGSSSQDSSGLRGVLDPMHAHKHLTSEGQAFGSEAGRSRV